MLFLFATCSTFSQTQVLKTKENVFVHFGAKSARIDFKIWPYLRRRLVNAWLKFKIAAWRFGVQLELSLELSLFFILKVVKSIKVFLVFRAPLGAQILCSQFSLIFAAGRIVWCSTIVEH